MDIKTSIRKDGQDIVVSTVILPSIVFATHQNYLGGGWETCIFNDTTRDSEVVERYTSEEAAKAGHDRYVILVKEQGYEATTCGGF